MKTVDRENCFDVIVVGGGHAGCEAALAAARMGARTLMITMNLFSVAQMSCNPAIGGLAKGHLVKEIDALGGEMGVVADKTGIQFKMLNKSKGPAVWSPRSQNDRVEYSLTMLQTLQNQPNLFLRQHRIEDLCIEKETAVGVKTESDTTFYAHAIILTTGTFLNGLMHIGLSQFIGGRSGEMSAEGLSQSLAKLGIQIGRLKTGTPPRVDGRTVDFAAMTIQNGDPEPIPFSHKHEKITTLQMPCFLTKTTQQVHEILRSGFDRSPLFQKIIKGVGPRYCPSIEDKINRFYEKDSHQIFLEPEGRRSTEYYVNGFSTSLPEDIQIAALRKIPGMEKAHLTRVGYAIEYDYFPPHQIYATMESKIIKNLFFAGQINGTSGYEEAAAQGIIAGINAVLKLRGEKPFILPRSEAYIGVLIDDLVTKEVTEPYRMFTSLAENRLYLRQDNADLRLMHYGYQFGLIERQVYEDVLKRKEIIEEKKHMLSRYRPSLEECNRVLEHAGSSKIKQSESVAKLLRRPELSLKEFALISSDPLFSPNPDRFWRSIQQQVEIEIKYEGFLMRQQAQIERMKQLEEFIIPDSFDYEAIPSLSKESKEKLLKIKPRNLAQAQRILGVSPSDIAILMMVLVEQKRKRNVPRGTIHLSNKQKDDER